MQSFNYQVLCCGHNTKSFTVQGKVSSSLLGTQAPQYQSQMDEGRLTKCIFKKMCFYGCIINYTVSICSLSASVKSTTLFKVFWKQINVQKSPCHPETLQTRGYFKDKLTSGSRMEHHIAHLPWCDKLICVNVNNQHFIIQKHSGHEDIIKDKDLISTPKTNLENKYFWLSETIWSYSSEDVQIWTSKAAKSKFCNAAIILDSESNLQDVIREACQN